MAEAPRTPSRLIKRRPIPPVTAEDIGAEPPQNGNTLETIPEKDKKSKWRLSNAFSSKSKDKDKDKERRDSVQHRNASDSAYFSVSDPSSSVSEVGGSGSTPGVAPADGHSSWRSTDAPQSESNSDRPISNMASSNLPAERPVDPPAEPQDQSQNQGQRVVTKTTTTTTTETFVNGPNGETQTVVKANDNDDDNRIAENTTSDNSNTSSLAPRSLHPTDNTMHPYGPGTSPAATTPPRPTSMRQSSGPRIPHRSPNRDRAELGVPSPQPQLTNQQPQYPVPVHNQSYLQSNQHPSQHLSEPQHAPQQHPQQQHMPQQYPHVQSYQNPPHNCSGDQQVVNRTGLPSALDLGVSPIATSRPNFSYPRNSGHGHTGSMDGDIPPVPTLGPPGTQHFQTAHANSNAIPTTPGPPTSRISTLSDLKNAAATLHGAGETIRGTVNNSVDKRFGHDPAVLAQHEKIINGGQAEMHKGQGGGGRLTTGINDRLRSGFTRGRGNGQGGMT